MDALMRVGLGYIRVGQQATTLSGRGAAREAIQRTLSTTGALYILDEPTTELHFEDVRKLFGAPSSLSGCLSFLIEHNLDVVKRRIGS